tara:strand:+ start:320 stop:1459 length:1140 start_codon:yes stop_codon:yes gene_type:complete
MKKLIFKKFTKDISLFFFILIISIATIVWIIQAVNYLDLISEDGHSLKVYFAYTLFSLPKIISKILPFVYMISLFYVIINYELNNELIIFWINGITKLNFVNVLLKISFLYFILQIILTTIIVPYTLDKGRSYFRDSDIDLFTSIIKEKKFIDTVEDLTIFVEKRSQNSLESIIIKERISDTQSKIILAKSGVIITEDDKADRIVLNNGKIINTEKDNQNIIDFSSFDLNLSKFTTNTITHPKTQEMSTPNLLKCLKFINNHKLVNENIIDKQFFIGCNYQISGPIIEEFLKRFLAPIFIILIGLASSLVITSSKNQDSYRLQNILKFIFGIIIIISSEMVMTHSGINILNIKFYFLIPLLFFLIIYSYVYFNLRTFKG